MVDQNKFAIYFNRLRIWFAVGLYIVSLALPGLHLLNYDPVSGWRLLLTAWYGFLIFEIPWLANIFFFVGVFMLRNDRTYRYAGFLGLAAFTVGLLSLRSKIWIAHHANIEYLGVGFYVWMAAFLVLASFVWVPNQANSMDKDMSDRIDAGAG